MHIYTRKELDRMWWNLAQEQREDYDIWYAFVEAYKQAR